jgi:branched-chain amino acid transport system permease protein
VTSEALGQILQFVVAGVTIGSIYAIVALGFTIIFSVTRIINFAQGEFVMLGGMLSWWLIGRAHLTPALAFVIAIALTVGVGAGLERLAIRPARSAPPLSLIILTVGASIVIRGAASVAWGKEAQSVPSFSGESPISVLGAAIAPQSLWVLGITLLLMGGLQLLLSSTMLGKALRACSINPRAAGLVGVDAGSMATISFALSAGLGAVGGVLISPVTMASYDAGVMLGLKGFTAAAVGGLGSQPGAVIGGLALGVLESFGAAVRSEYKDAIALVLLLAVLLLRSGRVSDAAEER